LLIKSKLVLPIILNSLGSGPVKGFAVTLMIGILISLFSALFVTLTICEFIKTYRKRSIEEEYARCSE
jgi:preprotein translocase subunit SecD